MNKWKLEALKEHIREKHKNSTALVEFVDSVVRTIEIYKYHECEVYPYLNNEPNIDLFELFKELATNNHKRLEHEKETIKIQAHIQAAFHNCRSMYDLFAQLLNGVLLSNKYPIYKCNINNVCADLTDSKLKLDLIDVLNSENYIYVNSFINTIKHRNLLRFPHTIDFVESKSAIKITQFDFNGRHFDERWGLEALICTYELTNQLIELGKQLNIEYGVKYA